MIKINKVQNTETGNGLLLIGLEYFLGILLLFLQVDAVAQTGNTNGSSSNAISTAVPFLNISPDARSGALGDAGVAISPDENAAFWNPAKLTFLGDQSSVSLSYSP